MDRLRVGIVVYHESLPTEGGGHFYYERFLKEINEFEFDNEIEIFNIVYHHKHIPKLNLRKPCIYIKSGMGLKFKDAVKNSVVQSYPRITRMHPVINLLAAAVTKARDRKAEKILKQHNIDLVYYLKPEFHVLNYPFIATHWDTAHRSIHPFPEISNSGQYEFRENYYLNTLNKAFMILCESEAGLKELQQYYPFYREKLRNVPLFPGDIVNNIVGEDKQHEALLKFDLKKDSFFIYPAQFWAHKNHYNLIVAFSSLMKEAAYNNIKLVLCGSDKGNLAYIEKVVCSLNLTNKVIFTGFVTTDELYSFYKNAIALIIPTFLGPTNMPVLEAAYLKCAVLCSDLDGHREIMGNNALYFSPSNAASIKEEMHRVLDADYRQRLVESASKHILQSPFNISNSLRILNEVLADSISKRKTWGVDF